MLHLCYVYTEDNFQYFSLFLVSERTIIIVIIVLKLFDLVNVL
jgi:hypothetical protein